MCRHSLPGSGDPDALDGACEVDYRLRPMSQLVHREQAIAETFVEVADTLVDSYDLFDLLSFLVHRCAALLEGDLAGVVIQDGRSRLRLAASTAAEMEVLEEVELRVGDGPCVHAFRSGSQVRLHDLADGPAAWSPILQRLTGLGMRSGLALPLRLRDQRLGALNLYTRERRDFVEHDVDVAQAFADVAAIGIIQHRTIDAAERRALQLEDALESRVAIEQAKGMLAQRHGMTTAAAFEALRRHARSQRQRVAEVAAAMVDGTLEDLPFP